MPPESTVNERLREMRTHFLVPPSEDEAFAPLDAAVALQRSEHQLIGRAFRHSLASALSTVAVPFILAGSSVEQSHFQRIYTAERIRAIRIDDGTLDTVEDSEVVRSQKVRVKAESRMTEFVESEEGRKTLVRDTCEFLLAGLTHGLEPIAQ